MKIHFIRTHQSITRMKGMPLNQIFNKPESVLEMHASGVLATFPEETVLVPFANLPQVSYYREEQKKKK